MSGNSDPKIKWSANPDWLPRVEIALKKVRPYDGPEEFFWVDVEVFFKAEHEIREDGSGGNECLGTLSIRVPIDIRELGAIEKYAAKRIKQLMTGAPEWILLFREWPDPTP